MNILPKSRTTALNLTGVMSYILPQNGVVEGQMHYGSGDSAPQIAMSPSLESRNGNVRPSDTPKRPVALDVNPTKSFAVKNLRESSDDIDDGSLPCTPELLSDSELDGSTCQAEDEALDNDTRQNIGLFLAIYSGLSKPRWKDDKCQATLRRVVDDVLEKHRYAYNGMINKLSLNDRGDDASFVSAVARTLFADGTTNWGRIVSLIAFGAVVSQYLKEQGRTNFVDLVGQEISTYLLTDQRDWLVKNNGWDGFVEFFRVADPESTVRNTLMAFAGFAGIGATLALLIR